MEPTTTARLAQPLQGKLARFFILFQFSEPIFIVLRLTWALIYGSLSCWHHPYVTIVDLILGTFDETIFLPRCGPPPPHTVTPLAVLVITTTAATLTASRALGNLFWPNSLLHLCSGASQPIQTNDGNTAMCLNVAQVVFINLTIYLKGRTMEYFFMLFSLDYEDMFISFERNSFG